MAWGLAASAAAGSVSLDLDEATDREAYTLTLDFKPATQVRFALRDRGVPAEVLRLLTGEWRGFEELPLGPGPHSTATLIRDDEFADRFFLRAVRGDVFFDLTLANEQLRDFTAAFVDLVEQLA